MCQRNNIPTKEQKKPWSAIGFQRRKKMLHLASELQNYKSYNLQQKTIVYMKLYEFNVSNSKSP